MKPARTCALAAALLLCCTRLALAADPDKEDAALSAKLLTALETKDYDSFVADGEAPVKAMTREEFALVAARLAPQFKAQHTVTYLGDLKQKAYHVTLWKISFKDGADDLLVTLSVKDHKVGGFWIK